MRSQNTNAYLLVALWVVATAAGVYITFFEQPSRLSRLTEAENVLAIQRSELRDLSMTEAHMREEILFAAQRWHARYKNVNDSLTTADVVDYVNRYARSGFSSLDVEYAGLHSGDGHSYYAFTLQGSGPFAHVYGFIWHVENNRDLFRVEELALHRPPAGTDIQFSFKLLAYFDVPGAAGSSDSTLYAQESGSMQAAVHLANGPMSDRPVVPDDVLPLRELPVDPFAFARFDSALVSAPAVSQIVGRERFSLRNATLVSIVGSIAIFEDAGTVTRIRKGDVVQEGEVVEVDAGRRAVLVENASGGLLTFKMDLPPLYRRTMGPTVTVPVG